MLTEYLNHSSPSTPPSFGMSKAKILVDSLMSLILSPGFNSTITFHSLAGTLIPLIMDMLSGGTSALVP